MQETPIRLKLSANGAGTAKATRAITEFCENKPAGPLPYSVWMGEGYLELKVFDNRIHLGGIFVNVDKRGVGLATQYLQAFLDIVDKHNAEVACLVAPFGVQPPGAKVGVRQLKAWYKKFGFKPVPGQRSVMRRPPQVADQ